MHATKPHRTGLLAREYADKRLPLQVLHSAAGYYIGTADEDGPFSRECVEYWPTEREAQEALRSGDWTQRDEP